LKAAHASPVVVLVGLDVRLVLGLVVGLVLGIVLAACGRVAPQAPLVEPCALGSLVPGVVEPDAKVVVVPVKKRAFEAAHGGPEAIRPLIAARLRGWPRRRLVDAAHLPSTDRAFVERLARDTWRGLDALVDREHGLPIDHVRFGDASLAPTDAEIGDYTNVTNVGLYLAAVAAAHDLGLVTRAQAIDRITRILDTLDRLERHAGFFFNYYDTTTLERTSNLLSFVDSAWLTAGLVVARGAFPELHARASRLIDEQDYAFFYDPSLGQMWHGYYVHRAAYSRYHYGILYAESRLGSLLAIGKDDVPEAHWFRMARTLPASCDWQAGTPHERRPKTVLGYRVMGGWYEWEDRRFVPSWGGSMFEALMPRLFVDEARLAPGSLGPNGVIHTEVQRRFARERLGYPVWGLSPAATPAGGYQEYGARPLGVAGYGAGAIAPYAAALALVATPDAALENLRALATRHRVYGDYGFYDAFEPASGRVAYAYLALDQGMTFLAAADYLTDGALRARFAADPIMERVRPLLAAEQFFG